MNEREGCGSSCTLVVSVPPHTYTHPQILGYVLGYLIYYKIAYYIR